MTKQERAKAAILKHWRGEKRLTVQELRKALQNATEAQDGGKTGRAGKC